MRTNNFTPPEVLATQSLNVSTHHERWASVETYTTKGGFVRAKRDGHMNVSYKTGSRIDTRGKSKATALEDELHVDAPLKKERPPGPKRAPYCGERGVHVVMRKDEDRESYGSLRFGNFATANLFSDILTGNIISAFEHVHDMNRTVQDYYDDGRGSYLPLPSPIFYKAVYSMTFKMRLRAINLATASYRAKHHLAATAKLPKGHKLTIPKYISQTEAVTIVNYLVLLMYPKDVLPLDSMRLYFGPLVDEYAGLLAWKAAHAMKLNPELRHIDMDMPGAIPLYWIKNYFAVLRNKYKEFLDKLSKLEEANNTLIDHVAVVAGETAGYNSHLLKGYGQSNDVRSRLVKFMHTGEADPKLAVYAVVNEPDYGLSDEYENVEPDVPTYSEWVESDDEVDKSESEPDVASQLSGNNGEWTNGDDFDRHRFFSQSTVKAAASDDGMPLLGASGFANLICESVVTRCDVTTGYDPVGKATLWSSLSPDPIYCNIVVGSDGTTLYMFLNELTVALNELNFEIDRYIRTSATCFTLDITSVAASEDRVVTNDIDDDGSNYCMPVNNRTFPRISSGRVAFLNGNNGEATNGDDMANKGKKQNGGNKRNNQYTGQGAVTMYTGRGKLFGGRAGNALKKLAAVATPVAKNALKSAAKAGMREAMNGMMMAGAGKYAARPLSSRIKYGGQGAYVEDGTEENSLIVTGNNSNRVLRSRNHGNEVGGITIVHEEFLFPIYCSGTDPAGFQIIKVPINPGMATFAKVLSQMAGSFTQYKLKHCVIKFVPQISEFNSTNGQVGMINMACNYNVDDPPYNDVMSMNSAPGAIRFKASRSAAFGVECDPKKLGHTNMMYVRRYPLATNILKPDYKLYDHANFYVAISDAPAAYAGYCLGQLYIEYELELILITMKAYQGYCSLVDRFWNTPVGGGTGSNPFGTVADNIGAFGGNNIGGMLTCPSNQLIYTFPNDVTGLFKWTLCILPSQTVAGASILVSGLVYSGNIDGQNWLNSANGYSAVPTAANVNYGSTVGVGAGYTPNTGYIAIGYIYVSLASQGINNTITITFGGGCTSTVKSTFEVAQTNQFDYNPNQTFVPNYITPSGISGNLNQT